jgi:hypothetical protein
VNAWLGVGAFALIYGLASLGIAMAFRNGGTRLMLNILVWIALIAVGVAVHFSS